MPSPPMSNNTNWETDIVSDFVALSTHKLFVNAAGPPRKPGDPVTGFGQDSRHFAALVRQISSFARVYSYDRSGYGRSEASPDLERPGPRKPAATPGSRCQRSVYSGGAFLRWDHFSEFLALKKEDVVGMVFVDANSEFSSKVRPKGLDEALGDLMQHVDFYELIDLEHRHKFIAEGWVAVLTEGTEEDQRKHEKAIGEEANAFDKSIDELTEKEQYGIEGTLLGDGVVSVVRGNNEGTDIKTLYEEGVKKGYGSEGSRQIIKQQLNRTAEELKLQEDQLKLSRKGRLVHAWKSGHDVHMTDPEIIVEEVRWVLEVLRGGKSS